jgi:E3 ubiquitin-protein ligase RNF115/126
MYSTLDLGYSTSVTKSYWCHICKREFNKIYIENVEIQCNLCGNNFCEEITNYSEISEHPSNFQPYESERNSQGRTDRRANNLFEILQGPRYRPRTTSSFLEMLVGILGINNNYDYSMENIINYIMANDPNRYGNPPASKNTVESLERVTITKENIAKIIKDSSEHSCSVCKDEFEVNQNIIYLPCKHIFHDDCILPWLKERNSCPTCRSELPTDDPDYEARKNNV